MTTFETLCRICSSTGEHDFFGIIPVYLHGNQNEFLNWQKPINVMVEETTGLKSSRSDGLPRNCCALCISYLKHAVMFRNQTIKNALSLKAIAVLRNAEKEKLNNDKNSLLITEQDLAYSNDRLVDTNLLGNQEQKLVEKELLNSKLPLAGPSADEVERQMQYLNLLFDKGPTPHKPRPLPDNTYYGQQVLNSVGPPGVVDVFGPEDIPTVYSTSSDEEQSNEEKGGTKHNIFSYNEKQFQEDDVMDEDELRDIVTVPGETGFKERKCRACANRFMFDQTYQQHMAVCIEHQFLTFIETVNRLLYVRQRRAISQHEFIRRMIFAMRKLCDWLKESKCGDFNLPNLNEGGEKRADDSAAALPMPNAATKQALNMKILEAILQSQLRENVQQLAKRAVQSSRFKRLLGKKGKPQEAPRTPPLLERSDAGEVQLQCTPITPFNNILYEIERSQSRSSLSTDTTVRSIDEFTSAPRLPSTASHSSGPVMKPIAVLARRQPSVEAPTKSHDSGLLSMDKPQPLILSHLEMEEVMRSKQLNSKSHIELEQELLRQHREKNEEEEMRKQQEERERKEQERIRLHKQHQQIMEDLFRKEHERMRVQREVELAQKPKPLLQHRPLSRKELQMEILRQNQLHIQQQQRQKELEQLQQQREKELEQQQRQLELIQQRQLELEQQQQQGQPELEQHQQKYFHNIFETRSTSPQPPTNIIAHPTKSPNTRVNKLSLGSLSAPSMAVTAPVTAQCHKCQMHFDALSALEMHNAQYHNPMAFPSNLPSLP